jgi:hypothetical protein
MAAISGNYYTTPITAPPPPTLQSSYADSLNRTPQDYNNIFGAYGNIAANPGTPSRLLSTPIQYQQSGDVSNSLSDLSGLAANGGYSAQNIADIRARGISPIRATFAAAQRQVQQQRELAGGYSPNFAAVTAKMARDQSNNIAQNVTNINAQLAQNIAQNRLAASGQYASAASQEAGRAQQGAEFNSSQDMQAQEGNANIENQAANRRLEAISGQRSLYGTTPALASTFGDQALKVAGLNSENANQYANRIGAGQRALVGGLAGGI